MNWNSVNSIPRIVQCFLNFCLRNFKVKVVIDKGFGSKSLGIAMAIVIMTFWVITLKEEFHYLTIIWWLKTIILSKLPYEAIISPWMCHCCKASKWVIMKIFNFIRIYYTYFILGYHLLHFCMICSRKRFESHVVTKN